jgi:hypothetical protein
MAEDLLDVAIDLIADATGHVLTSMGMIPEDK